MLPTGKTKAKEIWVMPSLKIFKAKIVFHTLPREFFRPRVLSSISLPESVTLVCSCVGWTSRKSWSRGFFWDTTNEAIQMIVCGTGHYDCLSFLGEESEAPGKEEVARGLTVNCS